MKVHRYEQELLVDTVPLRDWVSALILVTGGGAGLALAAPHAAGGGLPGLMLMVALASFALGLVFALKARGTRAVLDAGRDTVTVRSLGLFPWRSRRWRLSTVQGVEVALGTSPYGGARWRVCLQTDDASIPLSRTWTDDRADCERVAAEVREWLSLRSVPGGN